MISSPEKKKDKDKKEIRYKTNLYQNDTNYSISLLIVDGKLQILIKSSKNFSEDIYEFSNSYSFKQLQITNKYFSRFENIEEVCSDLDSLLKLKVSIEEDKDRSLILKIPSLAEKSSGDIIFKLMKTKKVKKIRHNSPDKLKAKNKNNKINFENNIKGINDKNNNSNELLLGNINELVKRVKNLEKKEAEKDKKITQLKEDINNYQEKINSSMNYPLYSPLANKNINLADDKNNNINQIIKQRNQEEDDDDVDMNLDTEKNDTVKSKKKKEKEKSEIKNKSKSKNKKKENSDEESEDSSETPKKKRKKRKFSDSSDEVKEDINLSNGKGEDSEDQDKSVNKLVKKNKENEILKENLKGQEQPKLYESIVISGFPMIQRENIKDYINSRIFYTIKEMQFVKSKITKGKKNIQAYFDLLYRASVDSDYEETINSLCEGHYPQITLFLTQEGARFGVYIDKEKTTSFFKKTVTYKEKPGTSFLFSLNTLKAYEIKQGETATDNRTEKLCFGRTYKYNTNESNWLIYVPRNEFLGVDLKFGDKESYFGELKYNDIVGYVDTYHLKDVEIFQVLLEKDGNNSDNEKDDYKKIIQEKEKKIEKENNKKKINNNDETMNGDKEDEDEKEEIKVVEKNNNKNNNNINNDDDDDDSD